jgi:hypothetical protein
MSELAAGWGCSHDEVENIVCEAALRVNLAVGIVENRFCDVMTMEEARAILEVLNESGSADTVH